MLKGIDLNQRIEFVSKEDNSEPKTIFVFKPLSAEEMMDFASESDGGQFKLSGAKLFKFLAMSIVDVKNFGNEGNAQDIVSLLRTLSPLVISELVQEACSINKLTGQDAKN